MKKTKKLAAALALSTTLAMGTVPAFAADPSVNDTGSFADDGNSSGTAATVVNVYASASQIQATIPVDITIVTPAAGGAITAPSATAYKIVNNNASTALKVTQVQGQDANDWAAVADFSADVSGVGELKMTVKAGSANPVAIKSAAATAIPDEAQAYFTVPADGGELGLTLAGSTKVASTLKADSTYPAVKIMYTVGV